MNKNMSLEISVVIPTFNRASLVRKVLPNYLNQQVPLEIIIVDDSTNPKDREDIQTLAAESGTVLICNSKREGLARSRMIGIRNSRCNFIFIGEDDLILPPDYLGILSVHQRICGADIIGSRKIWLRPGESTEEALGRADRQSGGNFDTFLMEFRSELPGKEDIPAPFLQCALIRKGVFQKIGFDEEYVGFTHGYPWRDETDFYMTANEKGFKVIFCPHTAAFNLPTSPGGTHSSPRWKEELWIWRNNYYILKKHKRFIKGTLKNRCPILFIEAVYVLKHLYGHARNVLWHIKHDFLKLGK